MADRSNIIQKYALFGSKLRGTAYIENLLNDLLSDMETHENLLKIHVGLTMDWELKNSNTDILKESFTNQNYCKDADKMKKKLRIVSPVKNDRTSNKIEPSFKSHNFEG